MADETSDLSDISTDNFRDSTPRGKRLQDEMASTLRLIEGPQVREEQQAKRAEHQNFKAVINSAFSGSIEELEELGLQLGTGKKVSFPKPALNREAGAVCTCYLFPEVINVRPVPAESRFAPLCVGDS